MVRKRLKTTNLQIENISVGKQTNTEISIFYLKGVAKEEIVIKEQILPEIKREELKGFIAVEWGGANEEYSIGSSKIQ